VTQSNAKVQFTFEIYSGDDLVRTEELAQDIIKVGKLPSSHLRIDDEAVSRMHAYIEVTGTNDVVIMDLGSATGTFGAAAAVLRSSALASSAFASSSAFFAVAAGWSFFGSGSGGARKRS